MHQATNIEGSALAISLLAGASEARNSSETSITAQPDKVTQIPNLSISEVDGLTDELKDFSVEHLHYQNTLIQSGAAAFDLIMNKAIKNETLELHFNSSTIKAKLEFNPEKNDSNTIVYVANEENCGEYEGRVYYGYDVLVAIAFKSTGRGYFCPSMIIETLDDGKRRDTGQRLLRLLRTRCVKPEIHAIIYFSKENEIRMIKKGLLQK